MASTSESLTLNSRKLDSALPSSRMHKWGGSCSSQHRYLWSGTLKTWWLIYPQQIFQILQQSLKAELYSNRPAERIFLPPLVLCRIFHPVDFHGGCNGPLIHWESSKNYFRSWYIFPWLVSSKCTWTTVMQRNTGTTARSVHHLTLFWQRSVPNTSRMSLTDSFWGHIHP